MDPTFDRIAIVGTSGSGKTTLARELARRFALKDIELDEYFWRPNWEMATREEFVPTIERLLAENSKWVTHGNHGAVQDLIWNRATTVIWLDYAFPLTFFRALKRTTKHVLVREELWSSKNVETFRRSFLSTDSLLYYVMKTWKKWRRHYSERIADPRWAHLKIYRFETPAETRAFLQD